MDHIQPLTNLKEGQWGRVIKLLSTGSIRRRILDLGIIEDTKIQCRFTSFSGDPMAFYIRGATVALRNKDSDNILIIMEI
jgi:ferrous iron transport protein A